MKILTYTTLFPNSIFPNLGIFIQHRTKSLEYCGNEVRVIAPVPYFPPFKFLRFLKRWYSFSQIPQQENIVGLKVDHPRYFNPPKLGMSLYGYWMYRATLPLVQKIYKEFPFDCIDAHYLYPDGFSAVLLGKKLNVPVILSARGTDAHLFSQKKLIRPLLKYALENASKVISVSENLKQDILSITPLGPDKIRVIPNGIDSNLFCYGEKISARKKLQLSLSQKIIVMVASLKAIKNQDILLSAIHFLKKNELVYFIGDGEDRQHLQDRIQQEGLKDRAFLLGAIPQNQLPIWYQSADVLCLPSKNEGSPNVVYEALGCGLPVVASDLLGIRSVICSSEKGILLDMNNPEDLANALKQSLWETTYDRFKISKEAQLRTWNTVGQEVLSFFKK